MTIEDVMRAVLENPEDDDRRLEYADLIEPSDPDHATYIRLEIEEAVRRRNGEDLPYDPDSVSQVLNRRHCDRWAHNLGRFLPRASYGNGEVGFDGLVFARGFPTQISIHPLVFLEYADLLFRLAPIRHVRFMRPYGQDSYLPGEVPLREDGTPTPFPLDEILAMPQLGRLESFGFDWWIPDGVMPDDVWSKIAQCPHLTRCRALDAGELSISDSVDALAAGPLTGKMLRIDPLGTVSHLAETESLDFYGEFTRTTFGERGRLLEARYGYIPWLHPSHIPTTVDVLDLQYHVEQGTLPKYKAGTPQMAEWYEFPLKIHPPRRDW